MDNKRCRHGGDIYNRDIKYDFSVNLNPMGVHDAVIRAVRPEMFSSYPDPLCRDLRDALSSYEGVPPGNILCTGGATEGIYAAVSALKPEKALICAPCFSEYAYALEAFGCETDVYVCKKENGFLPDRELFSHITPETDMIFICSPSNPAGAVTPPDFMKKLAEKAKENGAWLLIDECFGDLCAGFTSAKELSAGNVIIIKAFTKSFALAGLRLGYLMAKDAAPLERIARVLPEWNVSGAAQAAGIACCGLKGYTKKSLKLIETERARLFAALDSMGFEVFDGRANFLLFKAFKGLDIKLAGSGILIRSCEDFDGLDSTFFRAAVRTHDENTALISALEAVTKGLPQ